MAIDQYMCREGDASFEANAHAHTADDDASIDLDAHTMSMKIPRAIFLSSTEFGIQL